MKKIFTLVAMLCFAICPAQEIYDKVAAEVCSCIDKKNPDLTDGESIKSEYLKCFFESYSANASAIDAVEQIDLRNEDQMERLGENIAMKMLAHCPNYLMALGQAVDDEDAAEVQYTTIDGEISDIKTEQFVMIVVKDKHQKVHNLMLMDYFDTASLFTENQLKKKDNITATYSEIEMYDPKIKEFRYYKIISELKKN